MKINPIIAALRDMIYFGFESFGRYYSSYRGFVFSNQDPLNLQRVQLVIPEVGGNDPYQYWAIAKGVSNGIGYGSQVIPQPGELVWVEFEMGHPEVPIYSRGHMGVGDIPTDAELQDPNSYWFKTPLGHLLIINDTKKYIYVKTANGHFLRLDDTSEQVTVQSTKGHSIILDDKAQELTATSSFGDIIKMNKNAISLVTDPRKISLGSLDESAEAAVLGDSLKEMLGNMKSCIGQLNDAITADIAASTAGPYLTFTNLATTVPQVTILLTTIEEEMDGILSEKNTLD